MSAKLVVDLPDCKIYQGKADTWEGSENIDLVFTNPYGPMPESLRSTPSIFHQWLRRKSELEAWVGTTDLELLSFWNGGLEAFWTANMPSHRPFQVDVSEFKPEPGGWYPPEMVRQILTAYDPGTRPFTVFDGFCGRGTVGKVAREMGMNYIGVEELPEHIALARAYLGV